MFAQVASSQCIFHSMANDDGQWLSQPTASKIQCGHPRAHTHTCTHIHEEATCTHACCQMCVHIWPCVCTRRPHWPHPHCHRRHMCRAELLQLSLTRQWHSGQLRQKARLATDEICVYHIMKDFIPTLTVQSTCHDRRDSAWSGCWTAFLSRSSTACCRQLKDAVGGEPFNWIRIFACCPCHGH